jgi:phytoene/squalene synthetase
MSTISTKWGSDKISVTANWAQASDQIMGDLEGGHQVADFSHSPEAALRRALEQCARHEGIADDEAEEMIEAAMEDAVEVSDEE